MSRAAHSTVATVPPESNIEDLERRLLELRAGIDAILMQLAGQKAAAVISAPTAAPEPQVLETATEPAPETPTLKAADTEADPVKEVPARAAADATDEADVVHVLDTDAVTLEQASADEPIAETGLIAKLQSVEQISELPSAEAIEEPILVTSVDADPVAEDEAASPQAIVAEAQVHSASTAVEAPVAAALIETVAAEQPPAAAPAVEEVVAEVASLPVAAADATPADTGARVINFEPRQRKQKATFVATAAPVRRGRKVATRLAACIIALIAAGAALTVSDRTAIGTAQSLPWMSPLPSLVPSGVNWPFFGQYRNMDQGRAAGASDVAETAATAVANEAMLARYREIWAFTP